MLRLVVPIVLVLAGCSSTGLLSRRTPSPPVSPGEESDNGRIVLSQPARYVQRAQQAEPSPTIATMESVRSKDKDPERNSTSLGLPELGVEANRPGGQVTRIRVVVNSEAILEDEILTAAGSRLIGQETEAQRAAILKEKLEELIDIALLLQEAKSMLRGKAEHIWKGLEKNADQAFEDHFLLPNMKDSKISDPEVFRRYLIDNGVAYDIIRRQWCRQFMLREYLSFKLEPHYSRIDRQQIADYYAGHRQEFMVSDTVEWQNLFIAASRHPNRQAAQEFATVLYNRIRKGEDFVRLAQQYDDGLSGRKPNAEGTGKKRGEIRPAEAESALFQLQEGQTHWIEIETGFLIVRVLKRQQAGLMPFDVQVQKRIRDKLRTQIYEREMKELVSRLRERAIIVPAP